MARIGITLNEVLRGYVNQLDYTYNKYINKTDLKEDQITDFNLIKYFPFNSEVEFKNFLYKEASLEIFGHADQLHENIMNQFNMFHMDIQDDEEHEIEIVSREYDKSIPSTLFFLSKLGCKADKIRFVTNVEDKWKDVDVLITANPIALENKPKDKVSVKVKASYNTEVKADFEIDSLLDFMKDENLRNKILNTKTVTFEEN